MVLSQKSYDKGLQYRGHKIRFYVKPANLTFHVYHRDKNVIISNSTQILFYTLKHVYLVEIFTSNIFKIEVRHWGVSCTEPLIERTKAPYPYYLALHKNCFHSIVNNKSIHCMYICR